jgi:hypothetical protein
MVTRREYSPAAIRSDACVNSNKGVSMRPVITRRHKPAITTTPIAIRIIRRRNDCAGASTTD